MLKQKVSYISEYKNIPSDWIISPLGEVVEVVSGGTPSTKKEEYWNGEVLWATPTDISKSSKYITETERRISSRGLEKSSAILLPPQSVLVTSRATIGLQAINPYPMATNQGFKSLVPKSNVDHEFLYYLVFLLRKEMIRRASGSTFLEISKKDVENINILLPPLEEQQKIASILSTWDEAISMYSQLLDLKKSKKKHYLQYIFLDLTYFSKQNIKYDKQPLGDIAFTQSGGTPLRKNKEYYNGNIPWAVITDMTSNNKYLYETKETITDLGYKNSNVKLYEPNTILYAMYASIGECVITKIQTTANQAILNIKPIDTVDVEYLYYYLISIKEKVRLQGQQGTQSNLNAKMVREMRIPIPSKEVQLDIANFLRLLDDELELIEKLIEQLQEQKRGLMQLLLTGKVRV